MNIGKWNINFLLKNGYIEKKIPKLINYETLTKDYINKYKEIIWTLLIKNSYLIYFITSNNYCISGVRKLRIKTNDVGKLIIKIIYKNNLNKNQFFILITKKKFIFIYFFLLFLKIILIDIFDYFLLIQKEKKLTYLLNGHK